MRQLRYLNTAPIEEDCIGVGHPDYLILAKIECLVYMAQLKREHPRMPERFQFRIERCPYDCELGFYWEVVLQYKENDEDEDYAINVENNLPDKWDPMALQTLQTFPEYVHWMADKKTPYEARGAKRSTDDSISQAIRIIEEAGGFVMINEPEEEKKFEELLDRKPVNTRISVSQAMENSGMSIEETMFESVVPACCCYGCEVEPDGHCSHKNPSVLIAMGMI
jgi:hypothetical protein